MLEYFFQTVFKHQVFIGKHYSKLNQILLFCIFEKLNVLISQYNNRKNSNKIDQNTEFKNAIFIISKVTSMLLELRQDYNILKPKKKSDS